LGISIFCPKKSDFRKLCKCFSIKAKAGHGVAVENVLTAKNGPFLGVLAGNRGVGREKKAFYFALFHVLVVFCFCMLLSGSLLQIPAGSKKNRAQKPPGGFLIFESCAIIAP
jgi:hypothetical protein